MRLLLDTHVLLWVATDRLDAKSHAAIERAEEALVSAATIWELEIKRVLGRLKSPEDIVERVDGSGFGRMAIAFEHAREAARLPDLHTDPFDRMLVAQARLEGLTLVTADSVLGQYEVRLLEAAQA